MKLLLMMGLGYVLGSIPTGYLVGKKLKNIDIRKQGSGNVGATNVFRVVGKKWGIGVLVFDILKGFFAVRILPLFFEIQDLSPFVTSLVAGVAAVAGHTWTVWLGFRGGKGVATSLGVLLGLVPLTGGFGIAVWMVLFLWKRYVSLSSLGLALSLPLSAVLFYRQSEFFGLLLPLSLVLSAFIFYTHRENIHRLWTGQEKRLV